MSFGGASQPGKWRDLRIRPNCSSPCKVLYRTRSYGTVEERCVHTGKVAGSNPARTTGGKASGRQQSAGGFPRSRSRRKVAEHCIPKEGMGINPFSVSGVVDHNFR